MLIIPEQIVSDLVSIEDAISSVESTFAAFDRDEALPYPAVREELGYRNAVYGIKSGFDQTANVLGLKGRRLLAGERRRGFDQSPVDGAVVRSRNRQGLGPGRRQLPDRRAYRGGQRHRHQTSGPRRRQNPVDHRHRRAGVLPVCARPWSSGPCKRSRHGALRRKTSTHSPGLSESSTSNSMPPRGRKMSSVSRYPDHRDAVAIADRDEGLGAPGNSHQRHGRGYGG